MALRKYLLSRRGQILIESLFLVLMVSVILVIFQQLISYQKSRQHFRFARNIKEQTHAGPTEVNRPK